jgi:hypothetical protein
MEGSKVFISSCSRRELARRRASRFAVARLQMLLMLVAVAAGFAAFVAGRGGI